jgi:O-antigen/teichoic acid export membrane protein
MSNLSSENLDKIKIVKISYLLMLLFLLAGLAWSGAVIFLLPELIGKEFTPPHNVILYMSLGYSFTALYYIVTNYIFYTEKTKVLAGVTFFSALINVPLTYFLVKIYGLEGAALAFLVVQALSFSATWYLSNKVYPMPWLGIYKF